MKLLHRYFHVKEANEFRELQAKYAAIISGSSAIQFFERNFLDNSDLDVYVEHAHAQGLGEFLERIGYEFAPRDKQRSAHYPYPTFFDCYSRLSNRLNRQKSEPYNWQGIGDVYDFRRGDQNVQLITTRGSVMQVLLAFHSSELALH